MPLSLRRYLRSAVVAPVPLLLEVVVSSITSNLPGDHLLL